MTARSIVAVLGGNWCGSYGVCRCVCHDDRNPSLKIRDDLSKNDGIDVHCFSGCDWRDVKRKLRQMGLLPDWSPTTAGSLRRYTRTRPRQGYLRSGNFDPPADRGRLHHAVNIWRQSRPAAGTIVETYLRNRGITIEPPPTLRFHPALKHAPTSQHFPAMVAAVLGSDGNMCAVHRTFLRSDGQGKVPVSTPKMALGCIGKGAVRFAPSGKTLGLTEGIEDALSTMQVFGIPCWAALGGRIHRVALPNDTREVHLFADNGAAGRAIANKAADVFVAQGRRVLLRWPPERFTDWNAALSTLVKENAS